MLDTAQQTLFGDFPRAVGVTTPQSKANELCQYLIHSAKEFSQIIRECQGNRNLYSSISSYRAIVDDGGEYDTTAVVGDKVSFDFDSTAKAPSEASYKWEYGGVDDFASDDDVIAKMREDSDTLHAVLGDICDDVRDLATWASEEGIPAVGVFSGFGVHVHLLYEKTRHRLETKMASTANSIVANLSLSTADEKATGKPFRIMRVPNIERMADGIRTGVYTVPLKLSELVDVDPSGLLELSSSPRPQVGCVNESSRPQMKEHEEYIGPGKSDVGQEKMRSLPKETSGTEMSKMLVKEITKMPCVYERAFGPNPANDVRVKTGIMLLNAGYTVGETADILAGLQWADFDREVTEYQLESLQKSGKGDFSCDTMMRRGLCTRADDPESCPMHGYKGGNTPHD